MFQFRAPMFAKINGGGGSEPAVWARTVAFTIPSGTSNFDVSLPTGCETWTPKAISLKWGHQTTYGVSTSTGAGFGEGFSDGTNHRCIQVNMYSQTGRSRTSFNDRFMEEYNSTTLLDGVTFAAGKATFSRSVSPNFNSLVIVTFYGGPSLSAKVGDHTGGTLTGLGFTTNLCLFIAGGQAFNNTLSTSGTRLHTGAFSWDGTTLRQWGQVAFQDINGSIGDTAGCIRADGVWVSPFTAGSYNSVSSVTSDGFDLAGTNGYLALGFNGAAEAWCGVVDGPSATGNHDYKASSGAPTWTPQHAEITATLQSALDTLTSNDFGACRSFGVMDAGDDLCLAISTDNSPQNKRVGMHENAVRLADEDYNSADIGALDSMIAGGVRVNIATHGSYNARKCGLTLIEAV